MRNPLPLRVLDRFRRNTDGVMAVEFAIILPVFVLMLFGTMEIGGILYTKSTLQHAIETAGRYAMVHTAATSTEIEAEAVSNSSYLGSLSPTFTIQNQVVNGITYSVITVEAYYSVLTPLFTGRTITLSSSMSVPQVDPSDFS